MDDLQMYGKSTVELESLLNTVRIFGNDISMEFGLNKCASLAITRGKVTETEGMNLPNNNIKGFNPDKTYINTKVGLSFKQMISNILKSK